ncbi:MAG TPA: cytochrome c [Noviherbaspirillum sp.]
MKKTLVALVALLAGASSFAMDSKQPPVVSPDYPKKDSPEASAYRGSIVFHHYCELCHGVKADGNGRAAKLYNPRPANLVLSDKNDAYKNLIIRRGGKMLGRSEFMPAWERELTDEQIADVIAFLRSIRAPGASK